MIPNQLYHRLYRNEVPQEGDLVVVKILNVDDLGAKCELLEYGGIEGMLLATEYTRKRVKSLKKLIQPGNQEVLCVIHVDEKKKYIDLSKKQVTSGEIEIANNRFYRSSFVNSIMRYLSSEFTTIGTINIDDLYEKMCWLMDDEYGESYNALEQSVNNNSLLDKYDIESDTKIILIKLLNGKFIQQPKTISMVVEVKCLGPDGIRAIKNALLYDEILNDKTTNDKTNDKITNDKITNDKITNDKITNDKITTSVVKCPQYVLTTKTTDIVNATQQIRERAEHIKNIIESYPYGYFSIVKDVDVQ